MGLNDLLRPYLNKRYAAKYPFVGCLFWSCVYFLQLIALSFAVEGFVGVDSYSFMVVHSVCLILGSYGLYKVSLVQSLGMWVLFLELMLLIVIFESMQDLFVVVSII